MDHSDFLDGPAGNHDAFLGQAPVMQPSMLDKIKSYALSPNLEGASKLDPLADIARGGQWANKKVQDFSDKIAEEGGYNAGRLGKDHNPALSPDVWGGTLTGTLGEAFLPKNRLAAALTIAPYLSKGAALLKSGAKELPDIFKSIISPPQELMKGAEEAELVNPAEAEAKLVGAKTAPPIAPPTPAMEAPTTVQGAGSKQPVPMWKNFFMSLAQGKAKISPGMAKTVMDNPEAVNTAKSLADANEAYGNAVPGLSGKVQSLSQRLNKVDITPTDFSDAINRAWRLERGTEFDKAGNVIAMKPQDALEGVQTINQALRDKAFTSTMHPDKASEFLALKDKLLNFLQENGAPNVRQAANDLYLAHVKDAISDWLPRNKFGGTDALRTTLATRGLASSVGAGMGAAAAGYPGAAIGAALPAADALLTSPRIMGNVLKGVGAIANPVQTAARIGSTLVKAAPLARLAAIPLSNLAGGQPDTNENNAVAWLKMGNAINPGKNAALKGLNLPGIISGGGKRSAQDLADNYFGGDESRAIQFLNTLAAKQGRKQ